MGLKQDLIDAKVKALKESTPLAPEPDTKPGSYIERDAEHTKEAIVKFLTDAEFRITQLNAPVIVEKMKTPDLPVNIELETLLGEYQPVLKMLKQLGNPLGLGPAIDALEGDEVQTFEATSPSDTVLGVDIFSVIHIPTQSKIFVSAEDIKAVGLEDLGL